MKTVVEQLSGLKKELSPLARRGSILFFIIKSLASLRREYTFSLDDFLALFDEAIGGSFPAEWNIKGREMQTVSI